MITGFKDIINKSLVLCKLDAIVIHFDTNGLFRTHRLCKHQRCKPNRSKANHKHSVVSTDSNFLQCLIGRTKTTGYLRTIFIGERFRQKYKVLLLTENVWSHTSISLPAIGLAERTLAGNVIALSAVIADTAA